MNCGEEITGLSEDEAKQQLQPDPNPPEHYEEAPWFCPICNKNLDECECPSWYFICKLTHGWGHQADDYCYYEVQGMVDFKVNQRESDGKWLVWPHVDSLT